MIERYTTKSKEGINELIFKSAAERPDEENQHWRIRALFDGTQVISGDAIDKFSEYETAEEEGRLVVLPCKVGDTVYTFYDDMSDVVDFMVEKIQIVFDKKGKPYFLIDNMDFEIDCLGITLFLDHEEAEKALEKMKKA